MQEKILEDKEILEDFIELLRIKPKDNPKAILQIDSDFQENIAEAISNILKENENLKQAIKINHDLYETKCNENKQLEEENKELKKVKTDEFILNNPWLFKYLSEVYIPKSLVKEKIEEWNKERHIAGEHLVVQVLQELLREE